MCYSVFHLLTIVSTQKSKAKPKKPAATKAAPKKLTQTTLKTSKTTASKKRSKPDSDDGSNDDNDKFDDDSLLSSTPPKKAKKGPAPKKGGSKPLADVTNESFGTDGANEAQPSEKTGSSSDKYEKVGFACPTLGSPAHSLTVLYSSPILNTLSNDPIPTSDLLRK